MDTLCAPCSPAKPCLPRPAAAQQPNGLVHIVQPKLAHRLKRLDAGVADQMLHAELLQHDYGITLR